MIVLDTNVVSELIKPSPSEAVIEWVDVQDPAELMITALTVAEMRAGVALLPDGHRRQKIGHRVEHLITETFAGFVLAFDIESTTHYANVVASRTQSGRPISAIDAQIAAVCHQFQAALATRNVPDFAGASIQVINPWENR